MCVCVCVCMGQTGVSLPLAKPFNNLHPYGHSVHHSSRWSLVLFPAGCCKDALKAHSCMYITRPQVSSCASATGFTVCLGHRFHRVPRPQVSPCASVCMCVYFEDISCNHFVLFPLPFPFWNPSSHLGCVIAIYTMAVYTHIQRS